MSLARIGLIVVFLVTARDINQRRRGLNSRVAGLPSADPHYLIHRQHENFAIANVAGLRGLAHSAQALLGKVVPHHHLHLDLGV